MTTKQIFCALALVASLALAALAPLSPTADALAAGTDAVLVAATSPSPAAPAPAPSPIEAGAGALTAAAVIAEMRRRRAQGFGPLNEPAERLWKAIRNTLDTVPGYFESHLHGRSAAGDGSTIWKDGRPATNETTVLEALLDSRIWLDYPSCPDLLPGCVAIKTPVPGTVDLVRVDTLRDDVEVAWVDPGHGYQYPVIDGDGFLAPWPSDRYRDYTVAILGQEQGTEVIFTFHPGDPIRPSQVPADADTTAVSNIATLKAAYPDIEWIKVAHTA